MFRTLFPFIIGLLLMMLGILESSHLSGRAVEIGHDAGAVCKARGFWRILNRDSGSAGQGHSHFSG
jgi:hypothetical protein